MKVKSFLSSNDNVKKFVFEFADTPAIAEAVLYRYDDWRKRTAICCSVQSGCPVGCSFCGTGRFFVRNLESYEIVKQVEYILRSEGIDAHEIEKFQIMFMSMGEPFLNFRALVSAIRILHASYPNAQLLVSTSAPMTLFDHLSEFVELCRTNDKIGLQFSVHESTDENRMRLIPTSTCRLQHIAYAGEWWALKVGRKPFFNYCVHNGNSTPEDAKRLANLFNPDVWECTLSVICEKDESVKASIERQLEVINRFERLLKNEGFSTRVFNPAGQDDIGGGCGQLWYFQEWLKKGGSDE